MFFGVRGVEVGWTNRSLGGLLMASGPPGGIIGPLGGFLGHLRSILEVLRLLQGALGRFGSFGNRQIGFQRVRAGPGQAGPGIDKQLHNIVYMQFYDRGSLRPRVLEAQVPSVPRSHRSQGPIGPPKGSMGFRQGSQGSRIYLYVDIHIWISVSVIYGEKTQHTDFDRS